MYTTHRNSQKSREAKKNKKTKTKKKGEKSRGEQKKHPVSEETKGSLEEKNQKNPNKTEGAKCVKSINGLVGEKEN